MTNVNPNLHADDVLFFYDVRKAMFEVAAQYRLPLKTVAPAAMPESGMIDFKGRCFSTGDIEIVMRCTVDGEWCSLPRTPKEVWQTAAHELAHLRHMNHGPAFQQFAVEMFTAIENKINDPKQKVLDKLVKLQAQRDGEAALENYEAADAFARMINKMLIENELQPSQVDYARGADRDPVIEVQVQQAVYGIKAKGTRVAWMESLARTVANAHLCTFLIRKGSNQIWFVGTKSHAVVAEYAFGTLAQAAAKMCNDAYHVYGLECAAERGLPKGKWCAGEPGFCESWLHAFITRIAQRFDDARKEAVAEAPEGPSQALMRLSGAMTKVNGYIDDKFKARGKRTYALESMRSSNHEGASRGRAAADALAIGRKGVEGGSRKSLKA